MFRRVLTGARGTKLVTAALLVLALFAWAGSTVRTSGAEPESTKVEGTASESGKPGSWDGFKTRGPDLPVERLVVTIVILIGGAGIVLWAVRRFGRGRFGGLPTRAGGAATMQLVGRLPLGGRRGLVLVRAAGRLLVLGVSEAGVQKVLEREDREIDPDDFAGELERLSTEEER